MIERGTPTTEHAPLDEHAPDVGWFDQLKRPPVQAGIAAALLLVFAVIGFASEAAGGSLGDRFRYQLAATMLLMFGVTNALMSLTTNNVNRYWGASFISYLLLAALGLLVAYGLTGYWVTDAGSYRWIYSVLTFGYLALLSIVSMIRGIVNFAEREEWSQPRKRD